MKLDGRGFDSHRLHMNKKLYINEQIRRKHEYIKTNRKEIEKFKSYIEQRELENQIFEEEIRMLSNRRWDINGT